MARTGINIQVKDTVLGTSVDRNSVSAIFVGAYFANVDTDYPVAGAPSTKVRRLTSAPDLDTVKSWFAASYAVTAEVLYQHILDFYSPVEGLSNEGVVLYVIGSTNGLDVEEWSDYMLDCVRAAMPEYPRQITYLTMKADTSQNKYPLGMWGYDGSFEWVQPNGFLGMFHGVFERSCIIVPSACPFSNVEGSDFDNLENTPYAALVNCYDANSPATLVGESTIFYPRSDRSGTALGLLASIAVGQSIGDCSLPALSFEGGVVLDDDGDAVLLKAAQTDLRSDNNVGDFLDDHNIVYPRQRYPRTGVWFNDGSTLTSPENALSTLEAVRTLYAICDDLQDYFTTYINGRVPVTASGDIQPTFKQVVLDNARAKVIDKYIASGDISDARVSLVAKDNDMVGTRTWEVSVSILPAPTLRWIEGYVFYVNKLS
jgi:hypothetical protein